MSNLILMRHGQSIWNLQNRFTGGIDVPLTRKGILQAKKAGQELKKLECILILFIQANCLVVLKLQK